MNQLTRNIILLLLLLANVGCDQLSKGIAREQLDYHRQTEVLGSFLSLIKIENTGAFLSLGHNWPEWIRLTLLTFLPIFFLSAGLYILLTNRKMSLLTASGLGFMLGGGIGNMIDRLLYGSVTDFLHMDLGLFRTGIFNLADVSIMVGVGLMILDQFITKNKVETI
ncbi:signal peptidase II [Fulvivirga sedimenti]|uniref:Lipoprotein signal peptidase n=1 Tax=Fulvivirga sedimenti TaxID=2879465 RepID=A0A9X1HNB8_9BACT|nr:signal peptidase II [Fulvivirga sedimenti]MCA6073752.1 signal peptidase II [Fulvivirga sedimenti]